MNILKKSAALVAAMLAFVGVSQAAEYNAANQDELVALAPSVKSGDTINLGSATFEIGQLTYGESAPTVTYKGTSQDATKILIGNFAGDGNQGTGIGSGANFVFEDLTLDSLTGQANYTGFTSTGSLTFRNVKFITGFSNWGNQGGDVSFYDCTFNQTASGWYCIQELRSEKGTQFLFDGCVFESNCGRLINAYKQGGNIGIVVKDCTFKNTGSAEKCALNLKDSLSDGCAIDLAFVGENKTEGEFPALDESKKPSKLFATTGAGNVTVTLKATEEDEGVVIYEGNKKVEGAWVDPDGYKPVITPTEVTVKTAENKVVDQDGKEIADEAKPAAEAIKQAVETAVRGSDAAKVTDTGVVEAAKTAEGAPKPAVIDALKAAAGEDAAKITVESDVKSFVNISLTETKVAVEGNAASLKAIVYSVKPEVSVVVGDKAFTTEIPAEEIKTAIDFMLPLPASFKDANVEVIHSKAGVEIDRRVVKAQFENDKCFVLLASATFSEWTLQATDAPVSVAKIGSNYYPTLADAFKAVNNGETILLLESTSITACAASNKSFTLEGAVENAGIEITGGVTMAGCNVTFKNLTIIKASTDPFKGFYHINSEHYIGCTIKGELWVYGNDASFKDCKFIQTANAYCPYVYGSESVSFDGCNFDVAGKAIKIAKDESSLVTVSVKNCNFNATEARKPAVMLDVSKSAINLIVDEPSCKLEGEYAPDKIEGGYPFCYSEYHIYDKSEDAYIAEQAAQGVTIERKGQIAVGENIVLDEETGKIIGGTFSKLVGETIVAEGFEAKTDPTTGKIVVEEKAKAVAKIGDTSYTTLQAAVNDVKEGETINLLAGTITEGTITLPDTIKNVTIRGAAGHATILKGSSLEHRPDGKSFDGLTIDGIVFDGGRFLLSEHLGGSIKNLTFTNNIFRNFEDASNEAPIHLNVSDSTPVNGLTVVGNQIENFTGGDKSGVCGGYFTGNVTIDGNVFTGLPFCAALLSIADNDGVADNVVCTNNKVIGPGFRRAGFQIVFYNGNDNVNVTVNGNVFDSLTYELGVNTWGLGSDVTADLAGNYFSKGGDGMIYWDGADDIKLSDTANAALLPHANHDSFNYYTGLTEGGEIDPATLVEVKASYVCEIVETGKTYETLAAAFADVANDQTVKMIADFSVVFDTEAYVSFGSGRTATLDLNGKTIMSAATRANNTAFISTSGNLTITDTADKDGDGYYTGRIIHGADPTWIHDGGDDYSGSYESVTVLNHAHGVLTIDGGSIRNVARGSAAYAIENKSLNSGATGTTTLVINDGEIIAVSTAIRILLGLGEGSGDPQGANAVIINGGYVYGQSGIWIHAGSGLGAGVSKCDLTVNGGYVYGYDAESGYDIWDYTFGQPLSKVNYTFKNGVFPGYIWSYGANVTIEGGEFGALDLCKSRNGENAISITGGCFYGYVDVMPYGEATADDCRVVRGGLFANDTLWDGAWNLADYIAEGYEVVENTDSETSEYLPWAIGKVPTAVCEIGDVKYPTLAAAVAAVPDGVETTIKMIANDSGKNPIVIAAGKKVVLDLNGFTVSYVSDNTGSDAFITNKGDLKVTDTSIDKLGSITAKQNPDPSWSYGCYTIDNSGSYDATGHFVLEAGTIENTSAYGLAWPINNGSWGTRADVVINGGTVHSVNYVPVRQYYQYGGTKTMTINDGSLISDNSRAIAIQCNDPAIAEVDSFVKINGGIFSCNGSGMIYFDLHAANVDMTGAAIEVKGGNFSNANADAPVVAVDDEGRDQTSAVLSSKFISGGIFSKAPAGDTVAEGYEVQANADPFTKGDYPFAVAEKKFVPANPEVQITVDIKPKDQETATVPVTISQAAVEEMVKKGIVKKAGDTPTAEEVTAGLAKTQNNQQTVWQNYVMGIDGTQEKNVIDTIGEKQVDKPESVVVVKTPIVEFNPPKNMGVTVTYNLLKKGPGDVKFAVYQSGLAKPEFDVDTSKLELGDTLWKFEAVFSAEKPE